MELFRFKKDIPFMSYGRLTTAISLITFIAAVFFLVTKGLHLGVEFTGGTTVEVSYVKAANLSQVRSQINTLNYPEVVVQQVDTANNVMIRLPVIKGLSQAQVADTVLTTLKKADATVQLRKVEFVGPSVGKELFTSGALALLVVCLGIMAYLALRFEWRFAVSAIIANLHDVVIILGCFAAFQWEFNLTVLAGILAVLGYSVNESVVVFDRIRECLRDRQFSDYSIAHVIDHAITVTMSRTIMTHLSTELMVLAMLLLGGEALHGFATALTIGIVFGIYSSVLVASPIALWLGVTREHFVKPLEEEKEEAVI